MNKKIITLFSVLVLAKTSLHADTNTAFSMYAHARVGVNAIGIDNKPSKSSPSQTSRYIYRNSVKVPSLIIDVGIVSDKTFGFCKKGFHLVAGIEGQLSNTDKRAIGEFETDRNPGVFSALGANDIRLNGVTPYLGVCRFVSDTIRFTITGGPFISHGILRKMEILDNNIHRNYTGVSFRPRNDGFGGSVGFSCETIYNDIHFGISYKFTGAIQRYSRQVYLEQSGVNTEEYLKNLYQLKGSTNIIIPQPFRMKIKMHTLAFSVGLDW